MAQVDSSSKWTWMNGDSTFNQPGVYGTQVFLSQGNKPGARFESVTSTDADGKLWLMGGAGSAIIGYGFLNDMWKYDPAINKWTWMKGDETDEDAFAVYETMGDYFSK